MRIGSVFAAIYCLIPLLGIASSHVFINEYMASNGNTVADMDEDFSDWIELHNGGPESVSLAGYYLTDNPADPTKWKFPDVEISSGGFLVVWASGKDRRFGPELHTNFSLSSQGEPLLLVAPDGMTILDEVDGAPMLRDVSRGRAESGDGAFVYFRSPTPDAPNIHAGYTSFLQPPTFDQEPGFREDDFVLTLTHPDPDVRIVYTLDGSVPTKNSPRYTNGIHVRNRGGQANRLANIPTNLLSTPGTILAHRAPSAMIAKGTIVRAAAFRDGFLESQPVTGSFFVFPEGGERYPLPVISIVTDEDNFFDDEMGIYVPGVRGNPAELGEGNYAMRGPEWERPVSFEFFKEGGLVLQQDLGARIHGGWSRRYPQKTLRLYAREGYGASHIDYPFFGSSSDSSFRRVILRNSGNDWGLTQIRDATVHAVVRHLDIESQHYSPSVAFINGEFWGIHNIRERIDTHYISRRRGVALAEIDYLSGRNGTQAGSNEHYVEMIDFVEGNDLSDSDAMNQLRTMMDIDNYILYFITQVFHGNNDWPQNNIDFWRRNISHDPTQPPGRDGRWRWILYDVDRSFGFVTNVDYNMVEWVTDRLNERSQQEWPNILLRALLANEDFRVSFLNQVADHLNSTFLPNRVIDIIDRKAEGIEPVIEEHIKRWIDYTSISAWRGHLNTMRHFALNRPERMRHHLRDHFGIARDIDITIQKSGTAASSKIQINTLLIDNATPGIPDSPYPWTGTYFSNIPVTLTALPADGERFAGWQIGNADLIIQRSITVARNQSFTVTAHFETSETDRLMHYWNFNDSEYPLLPVYTTGGAGLAVSPAEGTEVLFDSGQGFTSLNARFGDPPGNHLRINNPLGATMTLRLPTTGFAGVQVAYETRRSAQGAGVQRVAYSLDGEAFVYFTEVMVDPVTPQVVNLDFRPIVSADNNPDFAIRLHFDQGEGGSAGNNRVDNIAVVGTLLHGTPEPPILIGSFPNLELIEGDGEHTVAIASAIRFDASSAVQVSSSWPSVLSTELAEGTVRLMPLRSGESMVTVKVGEESGATATGRFRVLVYPAPHRLAEGTFRLGGWSEDSREMTFPEGMIFLQSEVNDPSSSTPLNRAYLVPHDDYEASDLPTVGFPYNNTRRTRINGLGAGGISFINTGRGRDVGGALLALDTRSVEKISIQWEVETIFRNERLYGLQLEYRADPADSFTLFDESLYLAGPDGDRRVFGPLDLPAELLDRPNAQLLWRYHHVEGTSGPRPEIRLGEIRVGPGSGELWMVF